MSALLAVDSPTYLRRLAKELNRECDHNGSFYAMTSGTGYPLRCGRARVFKGKLLCWPITTAERDWFEPIWGTLTDGSGYGIGADRRVKP